MGQAASAPTQICLGDWWVSVEDSLTHSTSQATSEIGKLFGDNLLTLRGEEFFEAVDVGGLGDVVIEAVTDRIFSIRRLAKAS